MAKDRLEDEGFQVVGGFLSPVNDAYSKPGLIAHRHRSAMCRLGVQSSPWLQVDDWEAQQAAWSTTAEVLGSFRDRLARAGHGRLEVMLVSGADLVRSFAVPGLWLAADQHRILGEHGLVVVERAGTDLSEDILHSPVLWQHRRRLWLVKQHVSNDVSSSKVRLLVARGLSVAYLLPDSVIAYIHQEGLYKA